MITAWMLQSLVTGILLGAAALLGDELLRVSRLPRRAVWAAAAVAAVALPVLALISGTRQEAASPAFNAYVLEVSGATDSQGASVATVLTNWVDATSSWFGDVGAAAVAAITTHSYAGVLDTALLSGWLVLSAILLGLLCWTAARFARSRRSWMATVLDGTRVFVTDDVGPAVVGVIRPCIVMPRWLVHGSADQRRLILLHEREHVRRGDHALLAGAAVVGALLPWNLPLHWLLRRLRLAIELDCDRRVLAAGAPPRAYGAMLIDIAARTHRLPVAAAALADTPTDLEKRILAMTTRTARFTPLRAGAAAAMAAALVLVACEVDLMDPALQDATVGEAVDARMEQEPAIATVAGNARYFLDGQEVMLDDIRALEISGIAHVEVIRPADAATGRAEVRLTTKDAASTGDAVYSQRAVVAPARADRVAARAGDAAPVRVDGGESAQRRGLVRMMRDSAAQATAQPQDLQPAGMRLRVPYTPGTAGAQPLGAPASGVNLYAAATADGRQPLYVVDGVMVAPASVNEVLAGLTPDGIESIEIVKGEAAARLYGARAADGVIRITTRR